MDFIDQFMAYTEDVTSPEIFRLWSGIMLVAGALERRVWVKVSSRVSYPNLFVLLVAPPGVGKLIIDEVRELWRDARQPGVNLPAFHVAPDSMTKASLIDSIASATVVFTPKEDKPLKYHSLLVAAEEFSVLLPAYDMEYIGVLNSIWSNKPVHEETRRHGPARDIKIENPTLNMFGGCQPAWLAALFPEEAWSTGLARRLVMIYSTDTPYRSMFYEGEIDEGARERVVERLGQFSKMYGQMKWEREAQEMYEKWDLSGTPNLGGAPVPSHTKLQHYNKSRRYFAFKLCIISSASRGNDMVIRAGDVDRALGWMLDAERAMPDIFRAMLGKSDKDVIDEMHTYVMGKFGMHRNPVDIQDIRRFMLERVPHDKVEGIIKSAENANLISRVAGTGTDEKPAQYVPKARLNYAPE